MKQFLPNMTRPARHMAKTGLLPAILTAILWTGAAQSAPGFAPDALDNQISGEIVDMMQDGGIVGLTVAVTQAGRLVYSRGFGRSRRAEDAGGGIDAMQHTHRTRNGSLHKATISGPSLYKAMDSAGLDPVTTKVYGATGILGTRYETYQRVSTDRHRPIVATAIASDDRVYAWHLNGTMSIGTSANLTAHQAPVSYAVADGKTYRDLHAVAISPDDIVYAFYKDGTMSIGTSRDLDARQAIPVDDDGDPTAYVSMPIGVDGDRKSMLDVLGIGIAKSDSHVYIWYVDGTVSSGTSMDFDRYFKNRRFTSPVVNQSDLRFRIRGMGIAADDTVFTWASGPTAFAGYSGNLSSKRAPYSYSHAFDGDKPNWFKDITVQHLFDHTSGFSRSGDVAATARLFPAHGTPDYDLIHKHFLTTRPLKWRAGTAYSYSNHGMGLTTLLVQAVSGKTYREYAVNSYLKPMGLKGKVRAQKASPDQHDAYPYQRTSDGHDELPFKASETGLAAGGWTASAQGVLGITTALARTYGYPTMDQFGFRSTARGKLHHNGATGGGFATVAIFPTGYIANDGQDLSDIHVAIATNTGGLTKETQGDVIAMASTIAIATAQANLSVQTDYWAQAW